MNRFGDIFHRLRAEVVDADIEAVTDIVAHARRDTDTARIGQRFKARGDVNAIAKDIVSVDDDVADVDAETETNLTVFREPGVPLGHTALNIDGVRNRIDRAAELDQRPVARRLDDATIVLDDLGMEKLRPQGFEPRERTFLVSPHHFRIADNVRRDDRR